MLSAAREVAIDLGAYLAEARRLAIEEIRRFVPADEAMGPIFYDLMLDYPLREAKGLRPALCIATSRALGGGLEAVLPSAAILELYHNAFLVHDDVEDGSEQRRERPTLHREHGVPIAINVGDGMLALALQPLLDNTRVVGLGKSLRIMQTIATMARETAEGQAIELAWIRERTWNLTDAHYERMVLKKTGWYSFIAPVMVGAIVAGTNSDTLSALRDTAESLAIAFQIRDDILNLGAAGRYGKEINGDLWEAKRTLILLHMMRTLAPAQRAEAVAILDRPRPGVSIAWAAELDALVTDGDLSPRGRARLERTRGNGAAKTADDIAQLLTCIASTASLDYARAVGDEYARRAREALARAALRPSVHHQFLHALIDFTTKREH
ncbi:MAG: polyprenyl synthetase family protein [Kofleriaceae bacterium]